MVQFLLLILHGVYFMDITKNTENTVNEDYLAACQLSELIGDIERCATVLVTAARKAKENCDKNKNSLANN